MCKLLLANPVLYYVQVPWPVETDIFQNTVQLLPVGLDTCLQDYYHSRYLCEYLRHYRPINVIPI